MKMLRILKTAFIGLTFLVSAACNANINQIVIHNSTINNVLKTGYAKKSLQRASLDVNAEFKACYSKQLQGTLNSIFSKLDLKSAPTYNIEEIDNNIALQHSTINEIDSLSKKIKEFINAYAEKDAEGFLASIGLGFLNKPANKKNTLKKSVLIQSALAWSRSSMSDKKATEHCLDTRSTVKTVCLSNKKLLVKAIGSMIAEQYSKSSVSDRNFKGGSISDQPKFAIVLIPTGNKKFDVTSTQQLGMKKANYINFKVRKKKPEELEKLYLSIRHNNRSKGSMPGTSIKSLMGIKRLTNGAIKGGYIKLAQKLLSSFGLKMRNYLEQELSLSGIAHILKWIMYISMSISYSYMLGGLGLSHLVDQDNITYGVTGATMAYGCLDGIINKQSREKLLGIFRGNDKGKSEIRKIFNLDNLKAIFRKLATMPGRLLQLAKQNPKKTVLVTLTALLFIYFFVVPVIAPIIGVAASSLSNGIVSLASSLTGLGSQTLASLGLVSKAQSFMSSTFTGSTNDQAADAFANPIDLNAEKPASIGDGFEDFKVQTVKLEAEMCMDPDYIEGTPGSSNKVPAFDLDENEFDIDNEDDFPTSMEDISYFNQATAYITTSVPYAAGTVFAAGTLFLRSTLNSPFLNGVPSTVRGL